ncbi:unnamed protein product [Rhizophagus irregularis]|nr:unnamed protein product [Rhizophagus irregularis]
MSFSISKKGGEHPISKIWEWFVKGDLVPNSKGYYSATCSFCKYYWSTAKVAKLKKHLAYECIKVDSDTKISALMMLTNNYQINKVLAKMFVCCNLPFALIEHPFFIEFVKTLCTTYNLPSRWVLTETLIIQEIFRINLKVNKIINEENNMTITFDGWTNSTEQSIYNYCLITEERKEYLWCSKNYSNVPHHTGVFLGEKIIKIVDDIGPERLATVVSDNMPDACVAQRILCAKYPHILNIRCMAHCINLITKDLCKHSFVVDTIRKVGIVHQYFTMSHTPCQFLKDSVKICKLKEKD